MRKSRCWGEDGKKEDMVVDKRGSCLFWVRPSGQPELVPGGETQCARAEQQGSRSLDYSGMGHCE